nr:f-box protein [Quercus suber]
MILNRRTHRESFLASSRHRRLPDSILLLICNRIGDVKALGRCCVVSRRFHSLVPQVDNVVVRVDCVISDDDSLSSSLSAPAISSSSDKSHNPFSNLFRFVFSGIIKPFQLFTQFLNPSIPLRCDPQDFLLQLHHC